MDALLFLLPALGCAVTMAACMALMGRMHRPQRDTNRDAEVAALREEVARLRADCATETEPAGTDG
jgi:hypothetical protein